MPSTSPPPNLIDDINSRQDQVLVELNQLNERVEQVLKQCAPPRETLPDEA